MDDATFEVLCAPHTNLPTDIAAALLATADVDALVSSRQQVNPTIRFAGPSATACAKSHPARAAIVATRTADLAVQRALFEYAREGSHDTVLRRLTESELVDDRDLLIDIHDHCYTSGPTHAKYSKQYAVLHRVDLDHAMDWFAAHPTAYGPDLELLAVRVANTGDAELARRFMGSCSAAVERLEQFSTAERTIQSAASTLGTAMVAAGAGRDLINVLAGIDRRIAWLVVVNVWRTAAVVDASVAALAVAYIDPDWVQSATPTRTGDLDLFPNALKRANLRCTDGAWQMLVEKWPGLLYEPLRHATNDDPQLRLYVELALASRRSDLAALLLDRMYHKDGERSGPIVDATQYARAVENLCSADGMHVRQRKIAGQVAVSYIPAGAAVADVLRSFEKHSVHDIVETLCDPTHATWHVWRPTAADFEQLLDRCDLRDVRRAADTGVRCYGHDTQNVDQGAINAVRPYLDAVAARIPASAVYGTYGGPGYVGMRLTERFGANTAAWMYAWQLASTSMQPIDAVIRAAAKLS